MAAGTEDKETPNLRRGWTTGTCATAATRAAFEALATGHFPDPVTVTLPGGHFLVVPGLPRPEWLGGGSEALSVEEILALLRRPPES